MLFRVLNYVVFLYKRVNKLEGTNRVIFAIRNDKGIKSNLLFKISIEV